MSNVENINDADDLGMRLATMTLEEWYGVPTEKVLEIEGWLLIRKQEALKINPNTAETDWSYAYTMDPYGVGANLPDEYRQVGREYFARNPGSEIWVSFNDLPDDSRDILWKKAVGTDSFEEAWSRCLFTDDGTEVVEA